MEPYTRPFKLIQISLFPYWFSFCTRLEENLCTISGTCFLQTRWPSCYLLLLLLLHLFTGLFSRQPG